MSTELRINISDEGSKQPSQDAAQQGVSQPSTLKASQQELESMFGISMAPLGKAVEGAINQIVAKAKVASAPAGSIQEEADRRLQRIAREKEIDQEMRQQDAEYDKLRVRQDEDKARRALLRQSSQEDRDLKLAARQEKTDAKSASLEQARHERRQERDEDWVARQEKTDAKLASLEQARHERRQERDENWVARQEKTDAKLASLEQARHERRQERDENWVARDARRAEKESDLSWTSAQKKSDLARKAAQKESDREAGEPAKLMAMGGAAVGGTTGRMMGVASQVMGSPASMRMMMGNQGASAVAAGGTAGGAMAGAGAAMPIIGAAIAVGQMVKEKVDELTRSGFAASGAVMSGDIDRRMHAAVEAIGSVAPVAKEFARGINDMRSEVKQTTERLSQYNGQLAGQVAQQEVTELMRDINRANRMGGQLAATNAARFNFEQKVQDIADRLMPAMLRMMERTFNMLEGGVNAVERGTDTFANGVDGVLTIAQQIPGLEVAMRMQGVDIGSIRALIQEWFDLGDGFTRDAEFNRFMALALPVGITNVAPAAAAPGPVVVGP